MRHRSLCILSCIVALGSVGAASVTALAQTPTIACRAPHGAVARTICDTPEYVAMDREIAALTDRARSQLPPGELSRLAESAARYERQRKGCEWAAHNSAHPGAAIDECVRASLEGRVRRLRDVVTRSSDEAAR